MKQRWRKRKQANIIQLVRVLTRRLDHRLNRSLTYYIYSFLPDETFCLHVTRHIVLARPLLSFLHLSVFNARVTVNEVRFYVIGDIGHHCVFYEVCFNRFKRMIITETYRAFPSTISHQQFLLGFLQRTVMTHGIFHKSSKSCTNLFRVVACDGMSTGHFNMFRIINQHTFGGLCSILYPHRKSLH